MEMMGAGYGQSTAFTESLYASPPPCGELASPELAEGVEPTQQLQTELQPEPQPQAESEPQPQPQYEPTHTTQELIDWLEEVLEDEQIKNTPTEDSVRGMIESLKEEL
jgi:hypothetical protein